MERMARASIMEGVEFNEQFLSASHFFYCPEFLHLLDLENMQEEM